MEQTTGTIVGLDGAPLQIATTLMDSNDAATLRAYKKVLQKYGYKEALYCTSCWDRNLSDGCEAHVTSGQILIKCRCRQVFFQGSTY